MSKGIFTAVSGAIAQSAKLDTVANNLANVNTTGFKRDGQLFKEYLTAANKDPSTIEAPRVTATIDSFYPLDGSDKSYVDLDGSYSDLSQGALKPTGNKLDLAIEGDAFFEVLTPAGARYTRAGNFTTDGDGRLITKQGYPVQREGGGEFRFSTSQISISSNGEVFDGDQSLGSLALMAPENKDILMKQGMGLFSIRDGIQGQMVPSEKAQLHQGFLESSNVNVVREMTDMITATRTFESTQKAIQAYDQMASKVVNDVPKLR